VPATRDITILDLLTHTSGLLSGPMGNSVARAASDARHEKGVAYTEEVGTAPLEFQPGARWAYSAVGGFDVLSRVVEIVSGQSFSDFTRARIFGPLGMNDTTFWPTPAQRERLVTSYIRRSNELVPRDDPDSMSGNRYFSAAGGIMTTARDYAQFAMMLANGGELNGRRILSRRSVELMGSEFVPDTVQGRRPGESFGLGVRVVTDPAARGTWLSEGSFGWDGIYGTRFWADPKENLVGIIFTQTTVVALLNDFETAVMQAVD
jgi:CubicO group peptidase (beta-lactamase class C family)